MDREFCLLLHHITGINGHEMIRGAYERYCNGSGFPDANQRKLSLWLAQYALKGGLRLRLVDVWTRVFDRNNLIRHKLNLVMALAECSPDFGRITESDSSPGTAWLKLVGVLAGYCATFILSFFWIGGLSLFYCLRNPS